MKFTDIEYTEQLKLAVALRRTGRLQDALQVAAGCTVDREDRPEGWHVLGQCRTEIGAFGTAREAHQRAFQLALPVLQSPDRLQALPPLILQGYRDLLLGYAQALLRDGDWREGWPLWEAGRLGSSWSPMPGGKPFLPGEETPKRLLVTCEGGYGDFFLFMRWLPYLKTKLGVRKVGLMLWKPLAAFIPDWSVLGVDATFVIGQDKVVFADWTFQTSIMSLPGLLDSKCTDCFSAGDVPVHLIVDDLWRPDELVGSVHPRPSRIGFCWRSEEANMPLRTRSLSVDQADRVVYHLAEAPALKCEVFSLSPQKADLYGTGYNASPLNIRCEPDEMKTWRSTAAYICSMDFVLTVDTAVAHLAGLLGVPCLVLVPTSSDWKWGTAAQLGGRSWWYGPNLSVYRQSNCVWNPEDIAHAAVERIVEVSNVEGGGVRS